VLVDDLDVIRAGLRPKVQAGVPPTFSAPRSFCAPSAA
jgi:hypothetical protein